VTAVSSIQLLRGSRPPDNHLLTVTAILVVTERRVVTVLTVYRLIYRRGAGRAGHLSLKLASSVQRPHVCVTAHRHELAVSDIVVGRAVTGGGDLFDIQSGGGGGGGDVAVRRRTNDLFAGGGGVLIGGRRPGVARAEFPQHRLPLSERKEYEVRREISCALDAKKELMRERKGLRSI
jgi:hypothetical protein